MAFLNATSQFRKIVGKMVSYFEDEFKTNFLTCHFEIFDEQESA